MSSDTLKNVVVVGAATAGIKVAQDLATSLPSSHRVVLIEANLVAYWPIGALRASVEPGFEDKIVHELSSTTVFGTSQTRHVVLVSTKVIDLAPHHITVNRDVSSSLPGIELLEDGKSKMTVDKVVLAVGSDYGFPSRIDPKAQTREAVLEQFRTMQKDIESAQEILVIGGGPTGVEFVGEVLEQHPNKVITLLTRGSGLVTNGKDSFKGVSDKLLSQLRALGVRIILNDSLSLDGLSTGSLGETKTFKTEKGETISADFLLLGYGGKPSTDWIKSIDPSIVDPQTGLIKVNNTFSVTAPRWESYFAVGDAANTPGLKTSFMAGQHAPLVAHNVVAAVKNEKTDKLKRAGGPPMNVILVPLGKSRGASYMGFMSVGGWMTAMVKGKSLFLSQFEACFKG
ncbi:related to AIF1 - mitochondrial cell death effector [Melanopsichium pennsylvanicum]|uniref:Related to AIF1 - mitochondrial cell death effector n=2 Tax=Melanopsichium pennsylvanicum TaxID=63383 RepID=A0AAJ4XHZ4_9BASI|nr:pyridine nucleotide-disulphide [Melanopsichium pennsylvanicum 4]SNX82865.1 related to AIF1 - mitochondrial cell death effector [Melanopsichium pennsylvanicum]